MNVMIIGSGGREHAIAWKLSQSPRVDRLYCAPGNGGISAVAECVPIGVLDFDSQIVFAKEHDIELTIVAMDDPLVAGAVDAYEAAGLRAFGPRANAAVLEGSKSFSKKLMKKYHIPTADYEEFDDPDAAYLYVETCELPVVLKADGLALGKGVLICNTRDEARAAVKEIMTDRKFGDAGKCLIAEKYMTGREVSVLAFADGSNFAVMSSAQDHKRAFDGDAGPNTGGMGTFSPSPFYTPEVDDICRRTIYEPTIAAMKAEGRPFKGVLYFGLMLTGDGPKVVEYNVRFGDPEAQVILPRMKNDLLDVCEACIDGTLDQISLEFEDNAAVCVVLASEGYPVHYEKGYPVRGLDKVQQEKDCYVFHAGTKAADGGLVTNGGRVLGVTARGANLHEARERAYAAADEITFTNKYMRHDIGSAIDEI